MERVEDNTDLLLTTIDNPFDPSKQYDEWRTFDWNNGYYTDSYVDRMVQALTDAKLDVDIKEDIYDYAKKEIVRLNPLQYKLIHCETKEQIVNEKGLKEFDY